VYDLSELQDKHGRRKKGWAVTGTLKGVRLDAEGGGASLDDEKITLTELTETPGAPKVIEEERDANPPVNGKKVSRDEILYASFMTLCARVSAEKAGSDLMNMYVTLLSFFYMCTRSLS